MATIYLHQYENTLTIHFGGDGHRVNAYTLATTLVGIADAAKAANAVLNPGYDIEIVVDAFGPGSFKASIRAIYRKAENLFSQENLKTIVLSVIASFVYQHTLSPSTAVTVNVTGDEVVVVQGDTRIVVPRDVHEATETVAKSAGFRKSVADAIRSIDSDRNVTSLGFSPNPADPEPPLWIPHDRFADLPQSLSEPDLDERVLDEVTDLRILRAILERSRRRWEFVWNGIRISAPVVDDRFYEELAAHKITIAPGDFLRVRVRVLQKRDPRLGVFLNRSYEVTEVLEHRPRRPSQTTLSKVE
jgi:hypothetical protein